MRLRRARLGVAGLSLLVVGVATSAPASAESWTHRDPAKDVQWVAISEPVRVLPGERQGDITKTRGEHSASRFTMRVDFRDLKKNKHAIVTARIKTDELNVTLHLAPTQNDVWIMKREGTMMTCEGLRSRVSLVHNWVSASVPRSCLSDPAWIQFDSSFHRPDVLRYSDVWDYGLRRRGTKQGLSAMLSHP